MLFNLVCILHIILFEGYNKFFERDADALVYRKEHARVCYSLSKISHIFCIFHLLLVLNVVASQFVSLS